MNEAPGLEILFSEHEIAARVTRLAHEIVEANFKPDLAVPILVGGFVFAADLLRALSKLGLSLPVEFIRLKSYTARAANKISVLIEPGEAMCGKRVLLLDGVLDRGASLAKARDLLLQNRARAVVSAVAVDKRRPDAVMKADFAAFTGVDDFIVGYGMDDAGAHRALGHIARIRTA